MIKPVKVSNCKKNSMANKNKPKMKDAINIDVPIASLKSESLANVIRSYSFK
jgi:hypothetical protein